MKICVYQYKYSLHLSVTALKTKNKLSGPLFKKQHKHPICCVVINCPRFIFAIGKLLNFFKTKLSLKQFFQVFNCSWFLKFIFVLRAVTEHYDNIDIDTLNFGISQSGCLPSHALNNKVAGIANKHKNEPIS